MLKKYTFLPFFIIAFSFVNYLVAEPFVVLQYNNISGLSERSNAFAQNPDYSDKHTIMPGESLNLIIEKYYDGKVISFNDEFFDNAFSSEVFEHIFNIDEVLCEIHRVIKNNGKLCITCPFVWDEHVQPYDFARYTSYGIRHLLNKNGFELINFIRRHLT